MKKILLSLFLLSASVAATAQDGSSPLMKYSVATNSFLSNWFVQAGIVGSSFYGDKANTPASLPGGLTKGFRTNGGLSVALGKWFTPGLGLRTKFQGTWGRTVVSTDSKTNASRYWTMHEQVLFNFTNLFKGYVDDRLYNLIPYLGAGIGRNMTHGTYALGAGIGVLNQFRVNRKLSVMLDLSWDIYEPDFDGAGGYVGGKGLHGKDQRVSLEVGVTWHLGAATFTHTPDVDAIRELQQSQIDALNAQLADEQAESERLRQQINNSRK